MKNVHVLPTENYKQDYTLLNGEIVDVVRLGQLIKNRQTNQFLLNKNSQWAASCDTDVLVPHHIYITSDEELKEEDWCFLRETSLFNNKIGRVNKNVISDNGKNGLNFKKIILTTDQDLIANGTQAIDDEFLEWFVKNPSCEEVEVFHYDFYFMNEWDRKYKIILPKEKPLT